MNEFFKNVQHIWNGIPANRRVPILLAAVTIIASLSLIINYTNRPHMVILFGGMKPAEASKVVDFLKDKKVRYEIVNDGTTIDVPEADVLNMRLALASAGIPRINDTEGGVGFELFDKPSFGMPDFMQKANYNRALQGELARTIQQFEDVAEARVMINTPEERLFTRDKKDAKASVFLKLKAGRTLSPDQVATIRFLVANSVEGLQANHVAVADSLGHSLAPDDSGNGLGALTNTQLAAQQQYENHLRQNVQEMLDQVLGAGQSKVTISAPLNFDSIQQTSEHYDPKSSTLHTEQTTSEQSKSKTQAAEAAVGAKTGTEEGDQGKTQNETQTSKETAQNQYDIDRTVESLQKAQGVPQRVTAAVFINMLHGAPGANGAPSVRPRTPQEKAELQKMVQDAIGYVNDPAAAGRHDSVTVEEIEFATSAEPAPDASPTVTAVNRIKNQVFNYATQAILVLLAGVVLLYLRSILQTSTSFESDASGEFSSLLNRYKKMADDALAEIDREKVQPNTLSVDELSKLIRDNPGNTSQAIKGWMTRS